MRRIIAGRDRRKTRPTSTILRSTDEDRAHDAEIDRKEHADRDQRDLRGLEDAEPQDEQRHPGDRRNRAQRLQGRIEQAARQRPNSRRSRRAACRPRRRSRSPAATRSSVASDVALQLAGRARARTSVVEDARRRRHQAAVAKSPRAPPTSQHEREPTGSSRPSAGRAKRAAGRRGLPRRARSAVTVMRTRDMARLRIAIACRLAQRSASVARPVRTQRFPCTIRRSTQFVSGTRSSISASTAPSRRRWPGSRRPAAARARRRGSTPAAARRSCCA